MDEKKLIDLLITERISCLLNNVPEEMRKRTDKTADEIERLGEKMKGDQRLIFYSVLEKIAVDHAEEGQYLYINGIKDGIRMIRWLTKI